jgi:hypothetical protein
MENTYENYLRRPVYTFNNVQFLNSSKMKLKKQVLMHYLKDIVIMSFEIYSEILKEALATILTKTIICFGNW